jgi:hypothetical protein
MFSNASRGPRPFSVFVGALALIIPLAIGCGGGKGKISGSVTIDGQSLPAGTITFHTDKGPPVGGDIKDGHYAVTGVPTGSVKVTVETASIKQQAESFGNVDEGMAMSMGRMPKGNLPPEAQEALAKEKQRNDEMKRQAQELKAAYRPIPDKYSKEDASGLTCQVKSGSNTFDVPLTSK